MTLPPLPHNIRKSLLFAVSTRLRAGVAGGVSIVSFVFFVLLTFPRYSYEMILAGVQFWDNAFISLFWLMQESSGWIGVVLIGMYALLTGVLATVVIGNIRYHSKGQGGLVSVLPAIIFSGCASCGAGVLGLLGIFGYAAVLPFEGNLIRFVGIVLVVGVLGWIGDPRECVVSFDE